VFHLGQQDISNRIPPPSFIGFSLARFALAPPGLEMPPFLLEPLKTLLESEDLVIQLWHGEGSGRV
jgi:hypothetical protein